MVSPASRTEPASAAPLLRSDHGGVATLTLNRLAARQTLSEALIEALAGALDAIAADRTVRCVVLASHGPAFCAGHDLKEMTAHRADADGGRAYFTEIFARCSRMMQKIVALPQPVIAAVEGVATAAGAQLVASCDLAVAGEDARFCTPGVNIGLFCSTPMVALSRNLSRKHAMEMLLTGEMIGAHAAERFGLVNRVVPPGQALAEAQEMAGLIATKSPVTLRFGKRIFHEQAEMNLADAYAHASRAMAENMMFADTQEGICAFIEKRPPEWKGV